MKYSFHITFSTYITLVRLCLAPILVPFFIVNYLSPYDLLNNIFVALLFLFFALTDFLDGYCARNYNQVTQFGAILDHVADKMLLFSVSIALVAVGRMGYLFAILLLGRELCMMGLREIALEQNISIPVSVWGKLKTVIHIMLLVWIIGNSSYHEYDVCNLIEFFLSTISLLVSWISLGNYGVRFYQRLKTR